MDHDLVAFAQRLTADVRESVVDGIADENGAVYTENIFSEMVMDYLSEIGMTENPILCHYEGVSGRGKIKINGYAINDEEDRLDIFTSIYVDIEEMAYIPREIIVLSAQRAVRFFDAACKGIHDDMEPASDAFEFAKRIQSIVEKIERVRIFVITNGFTNVKKLESKEISDVPVHLEIMDVERLFRGMQAGLPREEISVDFDETFGMNIPCLPMQEKATDYQAYLAIIPGEILYKLYDEYGSRLLELNVRSFLSARGKINKGIRESLKAEPERFLAYNNGIVVTVDKLQMTKLDDGRPAIRSVKGLQIVNGGQTTASIHRARKVDKMDISRVLVPAKITVIRPEIEDEMVQMISRYANSQNTIQQADFSANDPFHVKIQEYSNTIWCPDGHSRWFYERARGSYQEYLAREGTTPARIRRLKERTPLNQRFSKTDLAKYINSWDQNPHLVSFGNQKNFIYFMQNLRNGRNPDWLPDNDYYKSLIAKAILFRSAQSIVRREKFPAHQANITTYLVAYVSWKTGGNFNFDGIWQAQGLSDTMIELLKEWSHLIDKFLRDTAGGRQISEWAKKESCWQKLKEIDFPLPQSLPRELISANKKAESNHRASRDLTPEDFRNIDACRAVDGETWLKIHAWGKRTGQLKWRQAGIAQTLAGYAAEGWPHGLSSKQAWHGIRILAVAREAGII